MALYKSVMTGLMGRWDEQKAFGRILESRDAELVAVYGRRRVGKTFLIREYFAKHIRFELTAIQDASLELQLMNFSDCLTAALKNGLRLAPPRDWREAFQQLSTYLATLSNRRGKHVVFLDELPWLATRRSGFLSAFEHFWNSWAVKQPHLVVVVCGSAASWMLSRLVHARGGLHNRVTRRMRLEPFTLGECREFLLSRRIDLGLYQTLELYMAMGGVPHYLKEVARGESASQAVERICFSRDGLLRGEFQTLYSSLFEHSDRHVRVVRALAKRPFGLTRKDLLRAARLKSGGGPSSLIEELEEAGFIMRTPRFGRDLRDAVYLLADEYSHFYLKWIEPHRGRGRSAWMATRLSPAWRAWSGYAFERVCLKHIDRLKNALGIRGVETRESAWSHHGSRDGDRGVQIDLLIDRRDGCINLCEMKYSEGEFVIDKRMAAELRARREIFGRMTRTRKALLLTMVTTYGVQANAYRDELIDSTITLDSLFDR